MEAKTVIRLAAQLIGYLPSKRFNVDLAAYRSKKGRTSSKADLARWSPGSNRSTRSTGQRRMSRARLDSIIVRLEVGVFQHHGPHPFGPRRRQWWDSATASSWP